MSEVKAFVQYLSKWSRKNVRELRHSQSTESEGTLDGLASGTLLLLGFVKVPGNTHAL